LTSIKEVLMRRVALVFALLATLIAPATATAAGGGCAVTVTPSVGTSSDIYTITVSDVPVLEGGAVEVQINIRRLGTRTGSVIWAFLIPGVTEFSVVYPDVLAGEEPPTPGRYQLVVTTPHLSGAQACHSIGQLLVVG
jgi:hypothetical protein